MAKDIQTAADRNTIRSAMRQTTGMYKDKTALLAETDALPEGEVFGCIDEGYSYEVAASGATDHHVTTAGGVKLYVLPGSDGSSSVAAFGAVGDGVTDDTVAFQKALATSQDVFVPEGDYLITDTLNVDQKTLRGQNGNTTKLLFDHVNGDFAVKVQSEQRGGTIENLAIIAISDGLKGVLLAGTVILRTQQLYINGFTEIAMQLGNSATLNGLYWSRVSGVRIDLHRSKTGTTGVLIEGAAIPGSNANTLEGVVIGGNYARPLHLQGRCNTVVGGTIELFDATAVSSLIYVDGSGNHVSGIYCEPVGTPPDILVEFGSGASGNYLDIWPQFVPVYNASATIIDNGEHNKVKIRRPGHSFRIGPEAEPGANLLGNSAFNSWRDAQHPYGWVFATGDISRVAPEELGGPSILRMTLTNSYASIQSYISEYYSSTSKAVPLDMERLRGKPVVCGAWCRTDIAGAGSVRFMSGTGGVSYFGEDKHSGSGDWELLLAHGNVLEAHNRAGMQLRSHVTNAVQTGIVDFRDPFFVIGSDVPFFSPKPLIDAGGKMYGDLEFPLAYGDKALSGILKLGSYFVWVDTAGKMRIGTTRPTDATWDTAGAVVGTQS